MNNLFKAILDTNPELRNLADSLKTLGMQTTVTMVIPSFSFADTQAEEKNGSYYKQGMKYQVLWLLHGFSGDHEDYMKFSNIVRYAEENKIVVVMPSAYNMSYTDQEPGAKYTAFITEELREIVQTYFPVSTKREDNFIGGLSMGSRGSMMIALAYPELYSYAFCMSGAVNPCDVDPKPLDWFGKGNYYNGTLPSGTKYKGTIYDGYYMAGQNVKNGKELPTFYITVGDKDFAVTSCENAYNMLKENGYDVSYELVAGYAHEWDFWDLSLRKALKELLPLKKAPIYE